MMNTKFSGLTGESDPLIGNREAIPGYPVTSNFTEPKYDGLRRCVQASAVRHGARRGGSLSSESSHFTLLRRTWKCVGERVRRHYPMACASRDNSARTEPLVH